jgi:hypothetical protein
MRTANFSHVSSPYHGEVLLLSNQSHVTEHKDPRGHLDGREVDNTLSG